jgi:ppGpp synthetase/RelA/SpoT-type nucleotidyltranferase
MGDRTIEDRLREEYFTLLPHMRRISGQLETKVRYHLIPISERLKKYEQLVVKSRVKDCESALEKLRGFQEGATFDRDRPDLYTLKSLKDLAGVRVLAFPPQRLTEIDGILLQHFKDWESDPVLDGDGHLAFKYSGHYQTGDQVRAEYQIVSVLTGLFWEVEHSAMYKPATQFRGTAESFRMKKRRAAVLNALRAFETEFENLVLNE